MNIEFWKATLIRAIRTICQTAIAVIGTAMVITEVDWKYVLSASLLAGLLSVLTSIATGLPEVPETKDYSKEIQNTFNGESVGDMMEGNYDEAENYSSEQ